MALREETELASRLARARVAGGTDPAADALAAEAALLELDNRIEAARASEEAAQVGLARWIGDNLLLSTQQAPDFSVLPVSRSEEHTSELQSLMSISSAVFCLKKKTITKQNHTYVT